jgi:hypothetical protein
VLKRGNLRTEPGDLPCRQDEYAQLDQHAFSGHSYCRRGDDALHSGRAITDEYI